MLGIIDWQMPHLNANLQSRQGMTEWQPLLPECVRSPEETSLAPCQGYLEISVSSTEISRYGFRYFPGPATT